MEVFDGGKLTTTEGFGRKWYVENRLILLAFSGFTGVFYGGMYLIKWHDYFPSELERLLWRISYASRLATVTVRLPRFENLDLV